jgi:hypothetical protein
MTWFSEPLYGFRQLVIGNLIAQEGDELFSRWHDVAFGNDAETIAPRRTSGTPIIAAKT